MTSETWQMERVINKKPLKTEDWLRTSLNAMVNLRYCMTLKLEGQGHRERLHLRISHQGLFPCMVTSLYWLISQRNKRPKGQHNVHLSTMCHLFWRIGQGGHFYLLLGPKNTNFVEDVEILLPVKFRWNSVQRFQRKSRKCLRQSEARVAILFFFFSFGPKNTNLVEDIEILLLVKFPWIPFSGFREEVENVSANQRPGRPSFFFFQWSEKHKLGRGRWDLASCQVLLNSIQQFQRRSRKCLSQSEARAAILFSDRPQKHKLGREYWDHASCQVSLNSVWRFQRRSKKCLSQSEVRAPILFFPIGRKHRNLVEDIEILLIVKFRWILLIGSIGEVQNVSANQRPGQPSCFSDQPEKHKLGRGRWDLAS